jgi:ribonuclease VapC
LFLDTSAIISILIHEDGWQELLRKAEGNKRSLTSPIVVLEATMVLASKLDIPPDSAELKVRELLDSSNTSVASIDDSIASAAIVAFNQYGKGRGHPARLNMADCLSYACAKEWRCTLLYVGNDFAQTDIA